MAPAVFDIPWPSKTGDSLQFVFYFGLVMACYPAFFALYPTIERLRGVRALQYSNGVRSLPLWLVKSPQLSLVHILTSLQARIPDIRRNDCSFYQRTHNHYLCRSRTQRMVEPRPPLRLSLPLRDCIDPLILHHIPLCKITTRSVCIFCWGPSVCILFLISTASLTRYLA